MQILYIILISLGSLIALILLAFLVFYLIQPTIITIPYSLFLSLFIKNPPYPDLKKYFPDYKLLEDNYDTIRAEVEEVLKNAESVPRFHEVDNIQRFISAKDEIPWRTFVLKGYGKYLDANCDRMPETTKLLKQLPSVSSALISIVEGGKHIPPPQRFFPGRSTLSSGTHCSYGCSVLHSRRWRKVLLGRRKKCSSG